MAIRNLLLLILVVGSLVIFVLSNMTPVVPLVILGAETQAFPLALWLLGAIAAGVVTTLLIAGLLQIAAGGARSRTNRFYADRPQYRPASADAIDDDDDWHVIDLGDDEVSTHRAESRSPRFSREPSPPSSARQGRDRNGSDRNGSDRQSPSSPSTSSASPLNSLDDWTRFTTPRTDWEDWNAYEEAPSSFSDRRPPMGDRPSAPRDRADSDTVIQDSVNRDWQDWQTHQSEQRDTYNSSSDEADEFDDDAYVAEPEPYPDNESDRDEDEDRWAAMSDRYGDSTFNREERYDSADGDLDDDLSDGYAQDYDDYPDNASVDEAFDDSRDSAAWEEYAAGYPSPNDAPRYADEIDDDEAPRYADEAYSDGAYADEVYSDNFEEGDRPSGWQATEDVSEGYYTVSYTEEDDYYDDYDEYVTGSRQPRPSPGDRPPSNDAGVQSDEQTPAADDDLADFDDWEAENAPAQPQATDADATESDRPGRIYEVPQRPASVSQSGTVYSYRYRPASEEQRTDPPTDTQPESNDSPPVSTDSDPSDSRQSSEPRILTTPPPTDGSENDADPNQ
jgi:hypothetical protein